MVKLTQANIRVLCVDLTVALQDAIAKSMAPIGGKAKCYPIPRGGVPAAYALSSMHTGLFTIVDSPEEADFFFDDIIDSGATMKKWTAKYPHRPFLALVDKLDPTCVYRDDWIVFPWEGTTESSVEDNIVRLLQFVGEDVSRGGLQETPSRVARAWQDWCSGYNKDPAEVLKVFEDGADSYDEMVVVADIPLYSKCEHHMADIFGTATIAYVPDGKIVGLSKLSRLLDVYAKRLQVQERLTAQVADALMEHLQPKGAGVVIKARHMCMESRGVNQQGHYTVTSALRGVLKDVPEARAEFMAFVG